MTERFATPGVRFVALDAARIACETAVLTRRDAESPATIAFLHAVTWAADDHERAVLSRPPAQVGLAA